MGLTCSAAYIALMAPTPQFLPTDATWAEVYGCPFITGIATPPNGLALRAVGLSCLQLGACAGGMSMCPEA